jgi:hypothetical protein
MSALGTPLRTLTALRDSVRPYARYVIALVAGLVITFTSEIDTFTALSWLVIIVTVSVALKDGPGTALNKAAWWATVVVVAMTVLGLLMGRMSTSTALSLSIALVAFETSRAFTRDDRVWLWSTGILAVGLSVVYFSADPNERTAAGLTGGWAIVAGIFGLIAAIDARVKSRRTTAPTSPSAKAKNNGSKR